MFRNIRSIVFFSLILLLAVLTAPTVAMTLREYAGEIKSSIHTLESMRDEEVEGEIELLRTRISSWGSVTMEGVTIKTDHRWLYLQLDSISKEQNSEKRKESLNRLIKNLRELQIALEMPEPMVRDPKPLLREILEREEFATKEVNPIMMRIMSKISEWLHKLFGGLRPNVSLSPQFVWFLKVLFYVVLGGLLIVIIILLLRRISKISLPLQHRAEELPRSEPNRLGNSQELQEEAGRYAKEGNYRYAVRYLYIALLVYLDEKGKIEYNPTQTNSEYLRRASEYSSLYGLLKILTSAFERYWYGLVWPNAEEYHQFLNEFQKARESA
ncbi:MAG: DUF4129 domain-containing protein [Deltaproteobacteria bacterium]|nr:DUF4129 domain-containing protein [Deltaproteobacteria bacterium]